MRNIKIIDDITKDGQVTFGDGYAFVDDTAEADAILMRSTDLHGYDLPAFDEFVSNYFSFGS